MPTKPSRRRRSPTAKSSAGLEGVNVTCAIGSTSIGPRCTLTDTLLYARGPGRQASLATLCLGGGDAVALSVERTN